MQLDTTFAFDIGYSALGLHRVRSVRDGSSEVRDGNVEYRTPNGE